MDNATPLPAHLSAEDLGIASARALRNARIPAAHLLRQYPRPFRTLDSDLETRELQGDRVVPNMRRPCSGQCLKMVSAADEKIKECLQNVEFCPQATSKIAMPSRVSQRTGFVALRGLSSPRPNSPFPALCPQAIFIVACCGPFESFSSSATAINVTPPWDARYILHPMSSCRYLKVM